MTAVHGLDYSESFLMSLPTVPASSSPIPLLTPEQLADLHHSHLVSHAPDNVLFPFLHGLEGSNPAQNMFFSSSDDVPRYRGLMTVVCEDDLDGLCMSADEDTDDDNDDLDTSSDDLDDMDLDIDIDVEMSNGMDSVAVHAEDEVMEIVGIGVPDKKEDKSQPQHMHPVVMKPPPPLKSPPDSPISDLPSPHRSHGRRAAPPVLTSTFRPADLIAPVLSESSTEEWQFQPLCVPEGISLRNFGIQVPILATLSDVVIYSPIPGGAKNSENAKRLAERFKSAIARKKAEREEKLRFDLKPRRSQDSIDSPATRLLDYNVFILDATVEDFTNLDSALSHLVRRCDTQRRWFEECPSEPSLLQPNTINFAVREKEEMRDLTTASEILRIGPRPRAHSIPEHHVDQGEAKPSIEAQPGRLFGQVFLGNSNDVPTPIGGGDGDEYDIDYGFGSSEEKARHRTNPPGYDICIECHDLAPFPSPAHLRAAEEKLQGLETRWRQKALLERNVSIEEDIEIPPRPPPHANSIIHLPFPSSPSNTASMKALVRFLDKWLTPVSPKDGASKDKGKKAGTRESDGRRWSLLSSAPSFPLLHPTPATTSVSNNVRIRSFTSPPPSTAHNGSTPPHHPSRPLKILIYSSDGYTESSVLALCLLISLKNLSLPEAYLELQVSKERSFFVYGADLGILRRWEMEERGKERDRGVRGMKYFSNHREHLSVSEGHVGVGVNPYIARWGVTDQRETPSPMVVPSQRGAISASVPKDHDFHDSNVKPGPGRRPRASTLPASSMLGWDHQTWFDDPRFDGSFPSRVLPFLYLGNLNHASNVYMLHALGITHVVSVGECALIPPPNVHHPDGEHVFDPENDYPLTTHFINSPSQVPGQFVPGKGFGKHGSLWIEERAGRIKVLDIQGVCDDGIDTLEPQLEPICQWMDTARKEGGKVLVHCRVGVSRSATVTIAYVMKHLQISLVEAYLIVRSRRLSVLIQPNMRLLYNLCGWEVKLAKQRAGDNGEKLKEELSRALSWPYLAREVHRLNEKYLH
ncbi:hypothetical protein IW261DRAFT_1460251 [Armillaria novae-zelandiae]|uniref:Protein-tyrosine-phosphatase n=1 Tax=Armillaria novae-zelandiae TaxID=153914 RepID=A0AA39PJ63_9AGAR|nr:hypothetical protein IW261DRAFT_1460251 [Armillaria novae-zelandiae]